MHPIEARSYRHQCPMCDIGDIAGRMAEIEKVPLKYMPDSDGFNCLFSARASSIFDVVQIWPIPYDVLEHSSRVFVSPERDR